MLSGTWKDEEEDMEEGGEEAEQEEDISELDEEERAEYQALNRQLDQLDKVTSGLKITVSYHSLALFQRFLKSIFFPGTESLFAWLRIRIRNKFFTSWIRIRIKMIRTLLDNNRIRTDKIRDPVQMIFIRIRNTFKKLFFC